MLQNCRKVVTCQKVIGNCRDVSSIVVTFLFLPVPFPVVKPLPIGVHTVKTCLPTKGRDASLVQRMTTKGMADRALLRRRRGHLHISIFSSGNTRQKPQRVKKTPSLAEDTC